MTVLVIDDDPDVRRLVAVGLGPLGGMNAFNLATVAEDVRRVLSAGNA